MMKEATKDPSIMMDAMKDLEDPENQAEVQRMMQDPSFRESFTLRTKLFVEQPSYSISTLFSPDFIQ